MYTGELITHEELTYKSQEYKNNGVSEYLFATRHDNRRKWDTTPGLLTTATNKTARISTDNKIAKVLIVVDKNICEDDELFLNYGENYFEDVTCLCNQDHCLELEKGKD